MALHGVNLFGAWSSKVGERRKDALGPRHGENVKGGLPAFFRKELMAFKI